MDQGILNEIEVLSRWVEFHGMAENVPVGLLRSVWGMTLRGVSEEAYARVFEGAAPDGKEPRPGYVLADLGETAAGTRRVRWTLVGRAAIAHDQVLCRAWSMAGRAGLGARRVPFQVADAVELDRGGAPLPAGQRGIWRLGDAHWPLPGEPAATPCRLVFGAGAHLREKSATDAKSAFVREPSWPRIVKSAWNRVRPWLSRESQARGDARLPGWMEHAADRPARATWQRNTVTRWSSRQQALHRFPVVTGRLDLPNGSGPVWPLLLAVHWLGLGHHTPEGMGAFTIESL